MQASRSRRLPGPEALEDRRLLAAFINSGTLVVTGTTRNDHIQITPVGENLMVSVNRQTNRFAAGSVSQLYIDGRAGNDWIGIDGRISLPAEIHGGAGNDRIFSGSGNDTIFGEGRNDRIDGGAGDDTIFGGNGNDWLTGSVGNDLIHGDTGNDHLDGGDGDDQLYGDAGNDQLNGNEGDDTLQSGDGNDILTAGAGNDHAYGDAGNDMLLGDDGDDVLLGGNGNDILRGAGGNDILKGDAGDDDLDGGAGDNLEDGDAGNNTTANGSTVDLDQQLTVQLTGATPASAEAHYKQVIEDGSVVTELEIEVEDAPPNSLLSVTIDGQPVGAITTNDDGEGSLIFSSSPQGNELPFPPTLNLQSGSTIDIGANLSGTFAPTFSE